MLPALCDPTHSGATPATNIAMILGEIGACSCASVSNHLACSLPYHAAASQLIHSGSHLPTFSNKACHLGLAVLPRGNILQLAHQQHAIANDAAKDDVLVVQPFRLCAGDEEL